MHTAREALDAVAIARAAFERYSFDLIYARPGQTPQMWRPELERAITEAAEHLSLYQLTIEADTPFAALHAAGKLAVPDGDHARILYDLTGEVCASAGLRHESPTTPAPAPNAATTSSTGATRICGIGPRHGRLTSMAAATPPRRKSGQEAARQVGHRQRHDRRRALSRVETADEFLLMGLRLAEGIDLASRFSPAPRSPTSRSPSSPCTASSRPRQTAGCG
jgi:oxygen-independent coproporphyrinogen-3 oxidase